MVLVLLKNCMGFDQGQPGPVVNPAKKTTKVNFFVVGAVILFFVIGGYFIFHTAHNKPQTSEEITKPDTK